MRLAIICIVAALGLVAIGCGEDEQVITEQSSGKTMPLEEAAAHASDEEIAAYCEAVAHAGETWSSSVVGGELISSTASTHDLSRGDAEALVGAWLARC